MIKYDYVKTQREDVREFKESLLPAIKFILRRISKLQVGIFSASNGRLLAKNMNGYPICMVTMKGAKSGKTRQIPLIHLPHGDNKLIVASAGGMPKNPVWYHNIVAHPEIQIMVAGEEKTYLGRRVSDEEKAELWPHLMSLYPDYDEYQARTDRNIPVFSCEPV